MRSSVTALVIVLGCGAPALRAADYPTKPIRLIVGFPPGGAGDSLARLAAQALGAEVRQTVVVDNRPGAGGIIGADTVAKASPDGYTLLIGTTGAVTISPNLQASIPYNPTTDFAPIGMIGGFQNVVVVPTGSPYGSLKELIEAAKAKPGTLNYASAGVGATPHMAGEMLRVVTNIQVVHVPYKGSGPALTDLFGGRVQFMLPTLPSGLPHVRAGRLRALAVTGDKPSPTLPDVLPVSRLGWPGYHVVNWFGLLAPARVPPQVVQTLHEALTRGLNKREMQERLTAEGVEPQPQSPQQMRTFIREEMARWGRVVKAAGIKLE